MRNILSGFSVLILFALIMSCSQERQSIRIIQNTIKTFDTINTISYQQTQ